MRAILDTITRTKDGTGSKHSPMAKLVVHTRQVPSRVSSAIPAFTGRGPPPMTTGTKWLRAPHTICNPTPTGNITVSAPQLAAEESQPLATSLTASVISAVGSEINAEGAATD